MIRIIRGQKLDQNKEFFGIGFLNVKEKLVVILVAIMALALSQIAHSYDNKLTHRTLTKSAFYSSLLEDNRQYLIKTFGDTFTADLISGTPITSINGKTIHELFQDGSDFEDGGPDTNDCRASNHFHNPLKPWDQAMMTDARLTSVGSYLINVHCVKEGWKFADRRSSLTWGTEYIAPSPDGGKIEVNNQVWSWDHARFDYLRALEANDKQDRDEHFASMFRTLGHVVHLIQDGAQPAHVRNDFESHLKFVDVDLNDFEDIYAIGVKGVLKRWGGSPYEEYVKRNTAALIAENPPIKPTFENPSLTDFWDTDIYDGTNPSENLTQGITEITNANYFSKKTIPKSAWPIKRPLYPSPQEYDEADYHQFPHPTITSQTARICTGQLEGSAAVSAYLFRFISRGGTGDCEEGDYLALGDFWGAGSILNTPASFNNEDIQDIRFSLDNYVYQAYAEKLLPLAVGYSAALIDYFFRGELGVLTHPDGLIIKNNSAEALDKFTDENNSEIGDFRIYYDKTGGGRTLLASYTLDAPIVPGDKTPVIQFTVPSDNITPGRYIAVFNGKLGKEEGAVIGKVVSPKIYYVSTRNTRPDGSGDEIDKIVRMEPDGSDKTILFDNIDPDFGIGKLSVSPDSKQLVFQGNQAIGSEIQEPFSIDFYYSGAPGENPYTFSVSNNSGQIIDKYTDLDSNEVGTFYIYNKTVFTKEKRIIAEFDLSAPMLPGEKTPYIRFTPPINFDGDYLVDFSGKIGNEEGWLSRVVAPVEHQDYTIPAGANVVDSNVTSGFKANAAYVDTVRLFLYDLSAINIEPEPLPVALTGGFFPDWSPIENVIAFQRGEAGDMTQRGQSSIWTVDLESTVITQITNSTLADPRNDAHPAWSPDGEKIAYVTNSYLEMPEPTPENYCGNSQVSIELMDANGSYSGDGTVCLNNFGYQADNPRLPVWRPDGNEMMYIARWGVLNSEGGELIRFNNLPYKVSTNNAVQTETALFNHNAIDQYPFPYVSLSSWAYANQDIIAITYVGSSTITSVGGESQPPFAYSTSVGNVPRVIRLMNSVNGDISDPLTNNTDSDDFYPVFAY